MRMEYLPINILVRTSHRPTAFARCLSSIHAQTYKNINLIVSFDNAKALDYIPDNAISLPVYSNGKPFGYNLYCNELKQLVTNGWFFFLDDDDELAYPECLEDLSRYLLDPNEAIVCQFLRNEKPKPVVELMNQGLIIKGQIGMPCIVLHHTQKNVAHFKAQEDGDHLFIQDVQRKMPVRFIHHVLVSAGERGMGVNE